MGVFCKGLCSRNVYRKFDENGNKLPSKRCRTCQIHINTTKLRCYCCKIKLRTRKVPTSKNNKYYKEVVHARY